MFDQDWRSIASSSAEHTTAAQNQDGIDAVPLVGGIYAARRSFLSEITPGWANDQTTPPVIYSHP